MTPRRRSGPPAWFAYVGVALASASVGWAAITQWFDLKQRVHDLEREQQYLHGTIDVPKEIP